MSLVGGDLSTCCPTQLLSCIYRSTGSQMPVQRFSRPPQIKRRKKNHQSILARNAGVWGLG